MAELPSILNPTPTPTAPVDLTPKRQVLTTRRSSQRGVTMSLETRPPRELLKQIGISGKEVVKIIRGREWHVEEPQGLQQQRLYYLPGTNESKGGQAKQNEDFFVGEGELYAYILKQGGLSYLLPDEDLSTESDESEVEPTQPSRPTQEYPETGDDAAEASVEEQSDGLGDSLTSEGEAAAADSEQRKWKRRKKLSTKRSKSLTEKSATTQRTPPAKRRRKPRKKNAAVEDEEEEGILMNPRVKLEQATYIGVGQQAEFTEYLSSLTARGWRAQLLQDVDVHLLRSVAAIDRRQRTQEASVDGQKKGARPTEGVGPHVRDAAEILHELEGLTHSIRASQDDLSSMIELIIAQGEQLTIPDRIDSVGRIGIPGFVSTGPDSLVLMRDIERYLLLVVAAVRRYHRTRKSFCDHGTTGASSGAVKRSELRALQLGIEESKRELQELAAIIGAGASKSYQGTSQDTAQATSQSASQSTSQGTSQSTPRTMECDADVDTDHDQSSSQQSVASPRRLEGGRWFV